MDWEDKGQQQQSSWDQPQQQQQQNSWNQPSQNYGPPPKTWLVESIIATLLCCQIFGIIGIVYSSQVESKHRNGDFRGAEAASRNAKNWVIAAAVSGAVVYIIAFFMIVLGAVAEGF